MKYIDPKDQHYRYHISETLNGFAIQVMNVRQDARVPLTPAVATELGLALPDGFRYHCGTGGKAKLESQLEKLAGLNGLVPLE